MLSAKLSKGIIGFILMAMVVIAVMQSFSWYRFLTTPIIPVGQQLHFVFLPGASVKALAKELSHRGYLQNPYQLEVLSTVTGAIYRLKSGEYLFQGGITPWQLLKQIVSGQVVQHHLRIIEGWTFAQVLHAVNRAPYLNHKLQGLDAGEVMFKLGYANQDPEGLFFPATYRYVMGMSDEEILQTALATMKRKLTKAWNKRNVAVPYQDPYQALIVASMIEKETSVASEKPIIAGVILNRIAKRMYLQIDPTVIFGLGKKYTGMITSADLHSLSPYNTYKNKGLPPTPIALPGMTSIQAALHPELTNDLYYVATGKGGHYFSENLKQHYAAIKKYRLYLASVLRKETLPLVRSPKFCWYLPTNLQFICVKK
jgi:UPF0755 protein